MFSQAPSQLTIALGKDIHGEPFVSEVKHFPELKEAMEMKQERQDFAKITEAMAKEVRADFLMALSVALDPDRPRWRDGDVFAKLFGSGSR